MDKKMLAIFVLSVLAILAIAIPAAAWWGGCGGWGWPWAAGAGGKCHRIWPLQGRINS